MIRALELVAAALALVGLFACLRRRKGAPSGARLAVSTLFAVLALVHLSDALAWSGFEAADRIGESLRVLVPTLWIVFVFAGRRDELLQDLREREEQLRFFLTQAPLPVAVFDARGRYVECSEEWLRRSGTTREQILGRLAQRVPSGLPTLVQEAFRRTRAEPVAQVTEAFELEWNGGFEWVRWRARSWPGRGERAGGIVLLVEVVTDEVRDELAARREENRLAHSQRIELIGELSSGIAHDLNNFLLVIGTSASLLQAPESEEEAKESLDAILSATSSATELVRSLLSMGRRSVEPKRELELGEVVSSTVGLLRRSLSPQVRVVLEVTDEDTWISAVRVRLQQLVVNLIVNAQDAMPAGGPIHVTVRADYASVVLSVRDAGTGIAPELRSKIFERFFTTKPPGRGTGLGLALVRAIVDEHEGTLDLETALGQGSTFTVRFPRYGVDERRLTTNVA